MLTLRNGCFSQSIGYTKLANRRDMSGMIETRLEWILEWRPRVRYTVSTVYYFMRLVDTGFNDAHMMD